MSRRALTLLAGLALLLLLAAAALAAGRSWTGPVALLRALAAGSGGDLMIWQLRMPRVLAGLGVGAAFGISGAVFQSLLRNPLAAPDVVGVTQGAALGAVAAILAGGAAWPGAVAGGLGATLLVFALAHRRGDAVAPGRLVLNGIGIGITASAGVQILIGRAGDGSAAEALAWLAGSLNGTVWRDCALIWAAGLPLMLALGAGSRALSRIEMGDDLAQGLGVPVGALRPALALGAALLAAVAVAVAGPMAFVALIAGPVARRVLAAPGPALAGAALSGALLVTAADLAARILAPAAFLPAGLYTGLIGAPLLIVAMARQFRAGTW